MSKNLTLRENIYHFYLPIQASILSRRLKNLNINPTSFLLETTQQSIKDELKRRTDNAYKKGIFGAPSFIINNKIFWGQDRLEFALSEASK